MRWTDFKLIALVCIFRRITLKIRFGLSKACGLQLHESVRAAKNICFITMRIYPVMVYYTICKCLKARYLQQPFCELACLVSTEKILALGSSSSFVFPFFLACLWISLESCKKGCKLVKLVLALTTSRKVLKLPSHTHQHRNV